jgi:hypothetical protein
VHEQYIFDRKIWGVGKTRWAASCLGVFTKQSGYFATT